AGAADRPGADLGGVSVAVEPLGPGPLPEALLRALDITIGRRIEGLLAGDYRSNVLGDGSELAQVRPYEPGDDVRRIDWNVTARQGRLGLVGLLAALHAERDAAGGGASLASGLRTLAALARQRSLVVVVSDFRGPLDWRRSLLELAARHDVLAVEIRDPREQ